MIKTIAFFLLLCISTSLDAQQIPILSFDEFESYLHQNDGKIHVVNFWATWCKPCVAELPAFQELNENYKDKGVEVLLVSLDFPDEVNGRLIPFLKNNNIDSKVLVLDDPHASQWIDKVSKEWSGAIPATLIYSEKKRLFYERSFSYNTLKHVIETKFLK